MVKDAQYVSSIYALEDSLEEVIHLFEVNTIVKQHSSKDCYFMVRRWFNIYILK